MCLHETHFRAKDTQMLKIRGWKKDFMEKEMSGKVWVAILISEDIFKAKSLTDDKEGHYSMIKGSAQEQDILLVNIYEFDIRAPKYIKQVLADIKGEIDNIVIIADLRLHFHQPQIMKP